MRPLVAQTSVGAGYIWVLIFAAHKTQTKIAQTVHRLAQDEKSVLLKPLRHVDITRLEQTPSEALRYNIFEALGP